MDQYLQIKTKRHFFLLLCVAFLGGFSGAFIGESMRIPLSPSVYDGSNNSHQINRTYGYYHTANFSRFSVDDIWKYRQVENLLDYFSIQTNDILPVRVDLKHVGVGLSFVDVLIPDDSLETAFSAWNSVWQNSPKEGVTFYVDYLADQHSVASVSPPEKYIFFSRPDPQRPGTSEIAIVVLKEGGADTRMRSCRIVLVDGTQSERPVGKIPLIVKNGMVSGHGMD